MLADMIGSMLLIFVVLAFYRLFKDVDKELAVWRRADGRARADLPGGVRQAAAGCAGNVVRGVARAPDHGRRDSVGRLYFQPAFFGRSEEHTSELQSLRHLVCRLLLEKKNKKKYVYQYS